MAHPTPQITQITKSVVTRKYVNRSIALLVRVFQYPGYMMSEVLVFITSATTATALFNRHATFTGGWPGSLQHRFTNFTDMSRVANLFIGETVCDVDQIARVAGD